MFVFINLFNLKLIFPTLNKYNFNVSLILIGEC